MEPGKFISIEGTEGAGKSTVLTFIQSCLTKFGIEAVWTREPGGTPLGEEIRKVLLHPQSNDVMMPETELLLMFAARAQHLQTIVKPALAAGKWVVSDRFIDASYAYQCGGRGIDEKHVQMLDHWIVHGCYPDLTLLLDIAPEQGLERASKRGTEHDRIEQEKIEFFIRVRDVYLKRASDDTARIKIIDASASLLDVETQIQQVLNEMVT
jgi:dTMP kinase